MKIAVIGSGISGLGAAYLLQPQHEVTLFEAESRLGGHSRTVEVHTPQGMIPVDTGFIVFNYRNYPLLTGLFQHLNVPVSKSDMSFAASIANGWLEYGTQTLGTLFAQKGNLLRPAYLAMLRDVLRFNRAARALLETDSNETLGAFLQRLGTGEWFSNYYLLAIGGAIWSTPTGKMLDFPAKTFAQFFHNHGLLTVNDQPQWYTVTGGSREYVSRIAARLSDIRLGCPVTAVRRQAEGVEVMSAVGSESFDQVVMACHSDLSLALLEEPTAQEKALISAIRYQPNRMVLHSDTRFMPRRKKAWASWVYVCESQQDARPSISLSYWMNRLQPLATDQPMIVTLNPGTEPEAALIHDEAILAHPQFDQAAIEAQQKIGSIQGTDRIWYCGAWQRYGFHEDGLLSAVRVAESLGASLPWK